MKVLNRTSKIQTTKCDSVADNLVIVQLLSTVGSPESEYLVTGY
jgi:hypothetical protein